MNTQVFKMAVFVLLICLLFVPSVSADKGVLAPVTVYEPGQKAIVAWDGENEILILATDVYASQSSWGLELLPLPSVPVVSEGDWDSFENVSSLVNRYLWSLQDEKEFKRSQVFLAFIMTVLIVVLAASVLAIRHGVPIALVVVVWLFLIAEFALLYSYYPVSMHAYTPTGGMEVLWYENIGAHHLAVVKAENAGELVGWAQGYLENLGIALDLPLAEMENSVSRYLEDQINYFVFDLVELGTEERSINPLVYQFESDSLYYPLEISSVASGSTTITLATITEGPLDTDQIMSSFLQLKSSNGVSLEFSVDKKDLSRISPAVADLFDKNAWLTILTYEGPLHELSGDLKISETSPIREAGFDWWPYLLWVPVFLLWSGIFYLVRETLKKTGT